jgi:hypothetical protein
MTGHLISIALLCVVGAGVNPGDATLMQRTCQRHLIVCLNHKIKGLKKPDYERALADCVLEGGY